MLPGTREDFGDGVGLSGIGRPHSPPVPSGKLLCKKDKLWTLSFGLVSGGQKVEPVVVWKKSRSSFSSPRVT